MAEGISLMPVFNDPQAKDDIRDIVLFLHQCKLSEIFQPTMVKMTDENFFATTENFDWACATRFLGRNGVLPALN